MRFLPSAGAALVLGAILGWSCTSMLPVETRAPFVGQQEARRRIKVGLFIDAETRAKVAVSDYSNFGVPEWGYPVGEPLDKIAQHGLSLVYSEVNKVDRTHPLPPGFDVAVQFRIDDAFLTKLHIGPIFWDSFFSSTLLLKCSVYDKEGKPIVTLISRGYARGLVSQPATQAGRQKMGSVADRALQRAMEELVRKLLEDKRLAFLPEGMK